MLKSKVCLGIVLNLVAAVLFAQPQFEITNASSVEVYKTIDDIELKAWIFNPPNHDVENKSPAIVFFFGGGWMRGHPIQFARHAEYLAARGMVAILVDYRVFDRHGVKAHICVADAKSSIRWMRKNADRLGIDVNRIVASGGSAGGHLAASTATLPGLDDPMDDLSISAVPNALALFNPVVVLSQVEGVDGLTSEFLQNIEERMGVPLQSISPYHHIEKGTVPTIIFHGTADNVVTFESVKLYDKAMDSFGNHSVLIGYEGEGHGFFNVRKKNNGPYIDTMNKLDAFLVEIGFLDSPPSHMAY